jgi:hypothetical protein
MSLLVLSLAIALQSAPEAEASAVVDRLHELATAADGPAYFDLFTPDARFVGTDGAERWSVEQFRAYAMPYFSQGKGWTYHPRDRVVTVLDLPCRCVAAFDELLDNDAYGETRGSGVLVRTDGGWKIQQYVLSFTVPNDTAKAVVGVIRAARQDAAAADTAAAAGEQAPSH